MTSFLSEGWIDTFRYLHPKTVKYSWWSARTKARGRNIGWRIDYHTVNSEAKSRIVEAEIWDEVIGSDHCPVVLNLK
jgi:exodeoxyribonuclease III